MRYLAALCFLASADAARADAAEAAIAVIGLFAFVAAVAGALTAKKDRGRKRHGGKRRR